MADPPVRSCVVCDARGRARELAIGEWTIERCTGCGLRVLSPEPTETQLVEVFEDGSIYGGALDLEAELMARSEASLEALERSVRPGRLLDVGFGPGFLLEAARRRGWEASGVDPSPYSVARAREKGFEVHEGLLEQLELPTASYDAIALMQVIEHIVDPRPLLAECARLVRAGGALLVATPNPSSLLARMKREAFNYWIPPVHCVWYTPSALRRVLMRAGFTSVRVTTWSPRTAVLDDGLEIVSSTTVGKRLPYRVRKLLGSGVAATSDRLRYGSIVEAVAVRP